MDIRTPLLCQGEPEHPDQHPAQAQIRAAEAAGARGARCLEAAGERPQPSGLGRPPEAGSPPGHRSHRPQPQSERGPGRPEPAWGRGAPEQAPRRPCPQPPTPPQRQLQLLPQQQRPCRGAEGPARASQPRSTTVVVGSPCSPGNNTDDSR